MNDTQELEQRTPEWHAARRGRLTGSNVGAALGLNPWKTPDDLIRSMVRDYHGAPSEFQGNVATEYGTMHEPLALMDFFGKIGLHVQECGFFVHPEHDWLGASPDGLINDDALIEVKCPYGLRNKKGEELVFKTAAEQLHYLAQMHVEMACTGRVMNLFYQWAPNGDQIEEVPFCQDWWDENLPKLKAFHERFLSELDNPEHLEDKSVEINTLAADKLLSEYDQLSEAIGNAEARKKEVLAELVKLSKERNAVIHGRKLTKVERKGNVQYAKIPELKGIDLEPYRGASSSFWKLS